MSENALAPDVLGCLSAVVKQAHYDVWVERGKGADAGNGEGAAFLQKILASAPQFAEVRPEESKGGGGTQGA